MADDLSIRATAVLHHANGRDAWCDNSQTPGSKNSWSKYKNRVQRCHT
jgi:hypothetical protein